jgi:hypothetical protein
MNIQALVTNVCIVEVQVMALVRIVLQEHINMSLDSEGAAIVVRHLMAVVHTALLGIMSIEKFPNFTKT